MNNTISITRGLLGYLTPKAKVLYEAMTANLGIDPDLAIACLEENLRQDEIYDIPFCNEELNGTTD